MSIPSQLKNLKSGRVKEYTRPIIPEYIQLSDGRKFLVRDLVGRRSEYQSYSRLSGRTLKARKTTPRKIVENTGYFDDTLNLWSRLPFSERVAISQSSIDDIMVKYNVSYKRATDMFRYSAMVVEKQNAKRP